jgi:hypothetical protein
LTIFVEIVRSQLRQLKKLSFLNKLEFKIVLKAAYPAEEPRVYFLTENIMEFGLNPFHDYLSLLTPDWSPKISVIEIIKLIPSFLCSCMDSETPLTGRPLLNEFFEVERLFLYPNVQSFPVRLVRANQICQGMLVLVNQIEIILLESTNFQNSYSTSDFLSVL